VTDIVESLRVKTPYPAPVLLSAADEIERLREQVALLRHAATIEAASLAEQAERADRLQALIDAYAEAVRTGTADDWHSAYGALLAAATPQEADR
jgi:hypothetical protein